MKKILVLSLVMATFSSYAGIVTNVSCTSENGKVTLLASYDSSEAPCCTLYYLRINRKLMHPIVERNGSNVLLRGERSDNLFRFMTSIKSEEYLKNYDISLTTINDSGESTHSNLNCVVDQPGIVH